MCEVKNVQGDQNEPKERRNVEAVILAGGRGTRLAPLTEDTPKPMLGILGRPVLCAVLEAVRKAGIGRACVTTMYLPWQIEAVGALPGLAVRYVREKYPLGTAGAVRNAYDGAADTVVVLSGDGVFDFGLSEAIAFHESKKADVTVVTHHASVPLEYGVVLTDDDGRVTAFSEKPPWQKVVSGSVNTGIYILSRAALEAVPSDTPFDFSTMLFPSLMASGKALYAYEAKGTWFDIGNPDAYFAANRAALDGTLSGFGNDGRSYEELTKAGVDAEMPVYVSKGAVIGKHVRLGAYTVVERGAVIADDCDVACSVIGEGTSLGSGCGIYGTLFGKRCRLGENCVTNEGCVLGDGVEVQSDTVLPKYAVLHSGSRVGTKDYLPKRFGRRGGSLFGDDGILLTSSVPPEYVLRVGQSIAEAAFSLASVKDGTRINVGLLHDGNDHASRISRLLSDGARARGVCVVDYGLGFEALAPFAAAYYACDAVMYVCGRGNERVAVRVYDAYGLAAGTDFERAAESAFFGADDYTAPAYFPEPEEVEGLALQYRNELRRFISRILPPQGLTGVRIAVEDEERKMPLLSPASQFRSVLRGFGGVHTAVSTTVPTVRISPDGRTASVEYHGVTADMPHLCALLIAHFPVAAGGDTLYLSGNAPRIYETLAACGHLPYQRYAEAGRRTGMDREEFFRQMFLRDGTFAALAVIALCEKRGTNLEVLMGELPAFCLKYDGIDEVADRADVMKRLSKAATDTADELRDGVGLLLAGGRVTVIPRKTEGIRVISEAASMETASELCDTVLDMIRRTQS